MDRFSIQDNGPPNPRQAEVDRTRDAAAQQAKAKHATPARTTSDGITAPAPGSAGTGGPGMEQG